MDFRRNLEICRPTLGPVVGQYTEWTPLQDRERLFPEDLDKTRSLAVQERAGRVVMAADPKPFQRSAQVQSRRQPWRIEDSLDLYHVNAWGKGYFSINDAGHVVVRPDTQPDREIDLLRGGRRA